MFVYYWPLWVVVLRVPAWVHMMKKRVMWQMLSESVIWPRSKVFAKEVETSKEGAWLRDSTGGCSSSLWYLPTHKALSKAMEQSLFRTGETRSSPKTCQQGLQQVWVCLYTWPLNLNSWCRLFIVLQRQISVVPCFPPLCFIYFDLCWLLRFLFLGQLSPLLVYSYYQQL